MFLWINLTRKGADEEFADDVENETESWVVGESKKNKTGKEEDLELCH